MHGTFPLPARATAKLRELVRSRLWYRRDGRAGRRCQRPASARRAARRSGPAKLLAANGAGVRTIPDRPSRASGLPAASIGGQNHLGSRTATSVNSWGPVVFGIPHAHVAGPPRRPGRRSPRRDRWSFRSACAPTRSAIGHRAVGGVRSQAGAHRRPASRCPSWADGGHWRAGCNVPGAACVVRLGRSHRAGA